MEFMKQDLQETRFRIGGMDCAACGAKIDNAVRRIPGVSNTEVAVAGGTLTVTHAANTDLDDVQQAVVRVGYEISPLSKTPETNAFDGTQIARKEPTAWWLSRRTLLTAACGSALVIAFVIGKVLPDFERVAFLIALSIGLIPVAWRAVVAATSGSPFTIEMLMTIAAVGAVIIGATEEAATVVFLFLIGEMLEGAAVARARASISGLAALVPKTAFLLVDGQTREVPANTLAVGARILVRPSDRIAADGIVVDGESDVDEAPVTGESVPKRKRIKDTVFAGTINGEATLHIEVTSPARDNTIARVVRLVEEAQDRKSPTERFIDEFSRYYTPGVIVVSALIAVLPPLFITGATWGEWIYKALAVLLIGCPCALVISTPAAIVSALASGARRGLLLKGGVVLEKLRNLTVIAFDKTGTLTAGKPLVTDVIGDTKSESEILAFAAALEANSSHPLALAILNRAKEHNVTVRAATDARVIPGKGMTGTIEGRQLSLVSPQSVQDLAQQWKDKTVLLNNEGKTVSLLLEGDKVTGLIAMRDEPREDATHGLKLLNDAGIKTLMLTGDNKITADAIGKALNIAAYGELLPQDKMNIVTKLQADGEKVGKVGDGINDAPALAAADVGIAMGGGTDVALETADAAILHSRVSDIAMLIDLSKRTMSNIHQNIAIALGLKAVFLVTTVMGITGLWPAILADTGATVLVTANAMRLLAWRNSASH